MELVNRHNFLKLNRYLSYLIEQKNKNPDSVERYRFLLRYILLFLMETPLTLIHTRKPGLSLYINGLDLSNETKKKIILHTKKFLNWCKDYSEGEFKKLPRIWIADLTPVLAIPNHDLNAVTEEEIYKIARLEIEEKNLAGIRDQAAACLLFLSGARGGALVSLPIQAVVLDSDQPHLLQYPELGVKTKNKKHAKTFLYPIPELLEPIKRWDNIVRSQYGGHALWYLPIQQNWGEQKLPSPAKSPGENREVMLNKRMKVLWGLLSAPHKSPHKFRHGCAIYGVRRCNTMAEYHIISRNLMHSSIKITDEFYVHFEEDERGKVVNALSIKSDPVNTSLENNCLPTYQNYETNLDQQLREMFLRCDSRDILRAISSIALEIVNK